jgi:DNA-binding SARP family transcriptional activator
MATRRGPPAVQVTPDLRVELIDGFAIKADTRPIQLPWGAQRVIAFLSLHERPLRRSHVAGALWLDTDEKRAGACLRSALWRIHTAGPCLVEPHDGCLRMAPYVTVDVRAATVAAAALMDGRRPACSDSALIELFSRELLPDWYEDWAILARERFRQLRLHALERLCERWVALGDFGRAIEAGLAAFAGEPLRESANIALIKAHLAEGNYVEAIRQYRTYERLVTTELGVGPSRRIGSLLAHVHDR